MARHGRPDRPMKSSKGVSHVARAKCRLFASGAGVPLGVSFDMNQVYSVQVRIRKGIYTYTYCKLTSHAATRVFNSYPFVHAWHSALQNSFERLLE